MQIWTPPETDRLLELPGDAIQLVSPHLGVEEVALALGISSSTVALLAAGKYLHANGLPQVGVWRESRQFRARLADIEKIVNNLRRKDVWGWRRVCELDLRFKIDDVEYVHFDGKVVHMPVGLETKTAIHEGLTAFLKSTTTTKLRRLLNKSYKYALDTFFSRHLVDKHLEGKVVTPVGAVPRNVDQLLITHYELVHRKGLDRIQLLEKGDWNASIIGHEFDSKRADDIRESIDILASQLATGEDGSKKLRDGRRICEVTDVTVFSYCDQSPKDVRISDIVKDVEVAAEAGHKAYILYPASREHDSIRERLLSSWLWREFHRDDWYESGPAGIRKGRISFAPDPTVVMVA